MDDIFIIGGKKLVLTEGFLSGKGGGEGEIFELNKGLAIKRFFPPLRDKKRSKVESLVNRKEDFQDSSFNSKLSFPIELVLESNERLFSGYLMKFFHGSKTVAESKYQLSTGTFLKEDLTDKIAFDLVREMFVDLRRLHRLMLVVGDVNTENILISVENRVCWVDVDSYGIPGYPTRVKGRMKYICPNVIKAGANNDGTYSHSEKSDIYVLAIVCFEFLTQVHPYEVPCTPPISHRKAMELNISYFSFIENNDKLGKYKAVKNLEYCKAKARINAIKIKVPDLHNQLRSIILSGDRAIKFDQPQSIKKKKKRAAIQNVKINPIRTTRKAFVPDPPELELFLKRYNLSFQL